VDCTELSDILVFSFLQHYLSDKKYSEFLKNTKVHYRVQKSPPPETKMNLIILVMPPNSIF